MKLTPLYPTIKSVNYPSALSRGELDCRGATVHYTADRSLPRVINDGISTGIGYHLTIDRDGSVHQNCWLDKAVAHAGDATWNGVSPNRHHVAVALLSWGILEVDRFTGQKKTWTGIVLPDAEIAERPALNGQMCWWDKATPEQEASIVLVLRWLMTAGKFPALNVCGHDECAIPKGRKSDPGGVLAAGMHGLRAKLESP